VIFSSSLQKAAKTTGLSTPVSLLPAKEAALLFQQVFDWSIRTESFSIVETLNDKTV